MNSFFKSVKYATLITVVGFVHKLIFPNDTPMNLGGVIITFLVMFLAIFIGQCIGNLILKIRYQK